MQRSYTTLKPLIIPIFIPHSGCPHQCAFCNQSIITDTSHDKDKITQYILPSQEEIRHEVDRFLLYKGVRKEVELAFFGGNFLGLKKDEIIFLLSSAKELVNDGKIDSIRFSTRPDTITTERLELISQYPVSTIEIGVQSMDNAVLKIARRGHTAEDTIKAASLLKNIKQSGDFRESSLIATDIAPISTTETKLCKSITKTKPFKIGMQMIVGLPEDNDKTALETARKIAELKPDFVRIYPLIVLEGSLIAKWYREGKYEPISLESSVKLVKEIFLIFQRHGISVIRMGLQASDLLQDKLSMVAGPWHPAFGHLVYSEIFFDKAVDLIAKLGFIPRPLRRRVFINKELPYEDVGIKQENKQDSQIITLTVHPTSISRLRGDKNSNIKRLKDIFPSIEFKIQTDYSLDKEEISYHKILK
ncbi:MAG: radical SAM protein [Desulfamplus sp.]|nr:radical SAM protein [Desulfamplus sp.]